MYILSNLQKIQADIGAPLGAPLKSDPISLGASLGAAGISALGGIIESIFGSSSQDSANKTNYQIAQMNADLQRETNAQQYKMFQEQNAFNEDMWNKNNAYNAPKEVVQRLRDAGISPLAAYGNGAGITPSSQIQSATAPQFNAPQLNAHMNPYFPHFQIGDAVNAYMQSELNNSLRKKYNAEAAHTETLNQFDLRSMDSRLKSAEALAKRDDSLGELARLELSYMQDSYYWRMKQIKNDVTMQGLSQEEMQQKIYGHKLANGLAEIQLAYAPKMSEAQLSQYYATVNQLRAAAQLAMSESGFVDEKRLGQIIDNGMKGLDFELQKKTKQYVYNSIRYESYLLGKDVRDYEVNWWNKTIQGYNPLGTAVAYGIGRGLSLGKNPIRVTGFK